MTLPKNTFVLALLPCLLAAVLSANNPCNPRSFGQNSVVCVCTETYCDTQEPVTLLPSGLVQIFESERGSARRLDRRIQQFNFGSDLPTGPEWNVAVERTSVKQDILGFGGSFSDAAALTIGSLTPALQRSVYNSYFSENGLEFSVARVTISGSDFSTRPYSYLDTPNDLELTTWSLQDEDLAYKIPQMKLADQVAKHKIKYFGSSWAPPAWMKTNGQSHDAGTLIGGPGSPTWESYAKYLVRFVTAYKAAGVDIWGMTVQNEPMTGFAVGFPWNTCGFTASMERDFVKLHLGPNLRAAGLDKSNFNLMVLDHDRGHILNWTNTYFPDLEADQFVSGVAVHWYGNDNVNVDVYDQIIAQNPDKFILSTEASVVYWESLPDPIRGDPVGLGDWGMAELYAHDIADVTSHSVAGWVDWNLSLNMSGGPTWPGVSERSAPIIVNPESGEYYKTPMFYALGHFSKFIPPGSRRLGTTPDQVSTNDFKVVAYLRPDGAVALVCINSREQAQTLVLNDAVRGELKLAVRPKSFTTYLYA